MITTFSNYIFKLNQGLIKTCDIEKTVRMINNEMGLMSSYDYKIDTNDNNLDIKLYKDPNYENGYYVIDNIPKDNIKIIEEQK